MRNLTLHNQIDASSIHLPYFLAATVHPAEMTSKLFQSYAIIEGEESICGMNVMLPTIGIFHIYIRAIILKKVSATVIDCKNIQQVIYCSCFLLLWTCIAPPSDWCLSSSYTDTFHRFFFVGYISTLSWPVVLPFLFFNRMWRYLYLSAMIIMEMHLIIS